MFNRFRQIAHGLRREPLWLAVAFVIIGGIWGFASVAEEVVEGETQGFDVWAVLALRQPGNHSRPIGPSWLPEIARDATGLGGTFVLTLLTISVCGLLLIKRQNRTAGILAATIVLGMFASLLLKNIFERPRPSMVPHLSEVYTSSFPSGHSMMSAVVYLTLATIVSSTLRTRTLKVYVFLLAFTAIVVVGLSRVYLGVHYPTDVLAGWTAGIVWALCAWAASYSFIRQTKQLDDL